MTYDGSKQGETSLLVPGVLACPVCGEDDMDQLRFVQGDGDPMIINVVRCLRCNTEYNPIDALLDDEDMLGALIESCRAHTRERLS